MPLDQDSLKLLANARRSRIQANGRPRINLTAEEIERSTSVAMRLADASKSQAAARAATDRDLP
jgi:hypothetical protein